MVGFKVDIRSASKSSGRRGTNEVDINDSKSSSSGRRGNAEDDGTMMSSLVGPRTVEGSMRMIV